MTSDQIKSEIKTLANTEKAKIYSRFFKTGKGDYAESDVFLGLTSQQQHTIAKKCKEISLKEVEKLLQGDYHEYRLTAVLILVYKYPKAKLEQKKEIYQLYLDNTKYINNWDIIDVSAPKIIGAYIFENRTEEEKLKKMTYSESLWERRIAMLSTFYYIKKGDYKFPLEVANMLVKDKHDLIHKAVGWMLREIGKKNIELEEEFLQKYHKIMPRTMLRYAIEKFPAEKRAVYIEKKTNNKESTKILSKSKNRD